MELHPFIFCVLAIVCAAAISVVTVPRVLALAIKKRLFDVPDNNRKLHKRIVPNLGGIAIFIAFILSSTLLMKDTGFHWNYMLTATFILFFTGLKDDLMGLTPWKKLAAQLFAAFLVVTLADIRLTDFYGLFGLNQLPAWFSYPFSIIGIAFVTNAFNLIDGVDGLAGSVAAMAALVFGVIFALSGQQHLAIVSFSLLGGILGFLYYNVSPARIFMGDTGSLFIGFILATLSISFVNSQPVYELLARHVHVAGPAVKYTIVLAILFVPIFDTLRVFAMRALKGHSPFRADRNHLHHYLLDLGFSHSQAVLILLSSSILLLSTCSLVYGLNVHLGIAALCIVAMGLFTILYFHKNFQKKALTNIEASVHLISANGALAELSLDEEDRDVESKPASANKATQKRTEQLLQEEMQ